MVKTTSKIKPFPGYILATPYINEDEVFKSVKETDGMDQKSVVIAIGDDVLDDNGNTRTTQARLKDIIVHAYSNKEFEIEFTKYRWVHFSEIHGVINE